MPRTTLPPAAAWDEQSASAWARSTYPRLLHRVVVVAAGTAFLVAAFDDTAPCRVEDPARCGPDVGFSLWFVLFVASVALQWWRPLMALASGVAFSVADIAFDPQRWTRWAFAGYLVVCLAVASVVLVSRQRQRTAVARTAGPEVVLPSSVPTAPSAVGGPTGQPARGLDLDRPSGYAWWPRALRGGPAVLVGALLLVAAGSVGLYARAVAQEQAHLARAVRVDAVAGDYRNDQLTLNLVDPAPWMPRTVSVVPTYDVPRGASWPVLLDPEDGDWVRAVAEPADPTWWLTIAAGATLVAALAALRVRERHRALPTLRARVHPALVVRVVRDPAGTVLVLPSGGHRVVATYRALPPVLSDEQLRALERLDDELLDATPEEAGLDAITPVEGVLVGDVREGGWAAVVTDEGVVPPLSPLRPEPHAPRLSVGDFLDPDDGVDVPSRPTWLTEVRVGGPVPDLPAEPPDTAGGRLLGWVVLVAVALGAPLATAFLVAEWHELIPVVALAVAAGGWGAGRAVDRVRLTHQGVEVVDAWTSTFVPWGRVDEVAAGRSSIAVEWGGDGVVADLYPHVHPRDVAHTRALAMAAGLRTLVDGAAAGPAVPLRRRPSPAAVVTAVGLVGTVVAALLRLTS